ncbi:unnamed protein product [Symbiodinium natans]|uniref:Transmembrane protein n=1 Tax=Symbiodinium natans TaxID=878477 RepID=A0A812MQ75_9DINO|nr:unnamed protein product [Symbiodinium natans]
MSRQAALLRLLPPFVGRRQSIERKQSVVVSGTSEVQELHTPEWIPAWFFSQGWCVPDEVKEMMLEKQKEEQLGGKLTFFDVAGPPVRFLWWATVLYWCYTVLLPGLAFTFTECSGNGQMMATYASWLWASCVPVFAGMFIIQWWCLMYTIVPMVQWLEFLPVGPIKQPPFWLWLGYNMTMSAITMTDVVTQGFFLASSLRMFTCQGWHHLDVAWQAVWSQSILHWIPLGTNLRLVLVLPWVVLLIQLPFFVFSVLPVRVCSEGNCVAYECRAEKNGYYAVGSTQRIWHADALKPLARLNRMALLNDGQFQWSVARAAWQTLHPAADKTPLEEVARQLHILKMEMRQLILRASLFILCQNCTRLEVQTTFFALARMARWKGDLWQDGLSLALTHLASLYELFSLAGNVWKVRDLKLEAQLYAQQQVEATDEGSAKAEAERQHAAVKEEVREIWHREVSILLVVCFAFIVQVHAGVKLVAALFWCPDAVWNFPNRCVDVPNF